MGKQIQIYVMSHKNIYVPQHPMLVPVQIGAAANVPIEGFVPDNTGDNISHKNSSYCELTGQYWVWKNICQQPDAPDYVGFFQYRRYLSFTAMKHPYEILSYPDEATLAKMGYDADHITSLIQQYDIIAPVAENMYETAWDNYIWAQQHYLEDLMQVCDIVKELYPDYTRALDQYMNGTCFYFKNMYIMKRELFSEYCEWLFTILAEFDQRNDWDKYHGNAVAMRVDGYLSERLFGIWYTYHKPQLKTTELSRVHFANMDGGKGSLRKMQLVNQVLPSGTRRRMIVARGAKMVLKRKKYTK